MQPRKQKDYSLALIISILLLCFLCSCKATNKVIKNNTDERGLTSIVMVTCSNDTFAFDYLDKKELDSIIHNK